MNLHRATAVLLVALTALMSSNAVAGPKGDKPMAVRGLDMITKALEAVTDLSDQQKLDTKAALADAEAQLVAVRDEAKSADKGDRDARKAAREKAMEIIAGAKTEVEAALNDGQKETFRSTLKSLRQEAAKERGTKQKDGNRKKGGKKDAADKPV